MLQELDASNVFSRALDDITFVGVFVLHGESGTLSGTLDISPDVLQIAFELTSVDDASSISSGGLVR